MFITGETVGLAKWIIDDTCLVKNYLTLFSEVPWLIRSLASEPQCMEVEAVVEADLEGHRCHHRGQDG